MDQDVDARSGSGAAQVTAALSAALRSDCIALGPGDTAVLRGWYRTDAGLSATSVHVELFAEPGCTAHLHTTGVVHPGAAGVWQLAEQPIDLMAQGVARSARVRLGLEILPEDPPSSVLFDSVELVPEPGRASLVALAALVSLARRRLRGALASAPLPASRADRVSGKEIFSYDRSMLAE